MNKSQKINDLEALAATKMGVPSTGGSAILNDITQAATRGFLEPFRVVARLLGMLKPSYDLPTEPTDDQP